MKCVLLACLLFCLAVTYGDCYCYTMGTPAPDGDQMRCRNGGIIMYPSKTLTITSKCERCTCSNDGYFNCCGYGIRAGVIGAPSGCKVIGGGADGCDPVMVQIADETKLCMA